VTRTNYFENPFKGIPLHKQVTNPNIKVGRHSYYSGYYHGHSFDDCAMFLMPDTDEMDKLIIGSFCSIASGVKFLMAGNQGHRSDWVSTFPFYWTEEFSELGSNGLADVKDTEIGNDVWIGTEALFMPGVTVGHGSIIGARTVVTKDVPPYSVVVGSPGKVVKKRFSDENIEKLLEISWWDWSDDKIKDAINIITSGDIDKLYAYAKS